MVNTKSVQLRENICLNTITKQPPLSTLKLEIFKSLTDALGNTRATSSAPQLFFRKYGTTWIRRLPMDLLKNMM